MKSSILLTSPTLQTGIMRLSTKLLSSLLFFVLLFAGAVSAQTVRQSLLTCPSDARDACSSNDLSIVSVNIASTGCINCTPETQTTLPLTMTIHNGTGSTRTSFALYGTLSGGASINGYSGNVFICVGPVTVTSNQDIGYGMGNQQFAVGSITFTCGQTLTLTNNFLKWTDASGSTVPRCEELALKTSCLNGPNGIGPKCGNAQSITIVGPPSATVSNEFDPCQNATTPNGQIKITPSGGKSPYSIAVYAKGTGDCPAVPDPTATPVYSTTGATGAVTATGLAAGTYCCYVTDDKGCPTGVQSITIGHPCCTPPGAPTVCQVPADLCGDGKVLLKVSGTVKDAVYHVKQGGTEVAGSPQTASADDAVLEFKVVPGGGNIEVWGVTSTGPDDICVGPSTTSDCANSPNGIGVCSTGDAIVASQGKTVEQEITLQKSSRPAVSAAPNPFNDRIRFSLKSEVSGRGSLELYNTLGQKMKTVFQGQVTAGQVQTIDYAVPLTQRAGLIYLFRVGNEQTSGKLIGLKK